MQAWTARIPLLLALLGGCGTCGTDDPRPDVPSPAPEEAPEGARPAEAEADEPAPQVAVFVDGGRQLRIESRGPDNSSLAPRVLLERRMGGTWAAEGFLTLRGSCTEPAPRQCMTMIPGAELVPPPWTGERGGAQCDCDDCTVAPPGTYRFVVQSCKKTHRIPTKPFEK